MVAVMIKARGAMRVSKVRRSAVRRFARHPPVHPPTDPKPQE
jgi:hypothetical protein